MDKIAAAVNLRKNLLVAADFWQEWREGRGHTPQALAMKPLRVIAMEQAQLATGSNEATKQLINEIFDVYERTLRAETPGISEK